MMRLTSKLASAVLPSLLLLGLFLTGCSTFYKAVRVDEVNYPFSVLRQSALKALPIGLRFSSSNGREIHSQYFVPDKNTYKEAIDLPVRFSAKIVLLGERRPYDVRIYVIRERRIQSNGRVNYKEEGQDLRIANMVKKDLEARLAQRREDLNIIDDFRVF